MKVVKLKLSQLTFLRSIQVRERMNATVVAEYAERIEAGDKFPPVVVFTDGVRYWVSDGWHRSAAYRRCAYLEIEGELHQGNESAALKYALSANREHGLRLTNADKRRAVLMALARFPNYSARYVAQLCGTSAQLVSMCRNELGGEPISRVGLDGKTRRQPQVVRTKRPIDLGKAVNTVRNYMRVSGFKKCVIGLRVSSFK